MLSDATRKLLDRYALASRALSRTSGERLAREAGQSVEFHDYRPYQPGDELRAVDWRVYARTGRVMTRLYQAERTIDVHVLLDTSRSMAIGGKLPYATGVARLLAYVAHRDARVQVHDVRGGRSAAGIGRAALAAAWGTLADADTGPDAPMPVAAIRAFALGLPRVRGAGLVLVVSDLFDPAPLRPALLALRARGLDAAFLHVVAEDDLDPVPGRLEVVDAESGERMLAGPDEVDAYREAAQTFVRRTRAAINQAGYAHVLLRTDAVPPEAARPTRRRPGATGAGRAGAVRDVGLPADAALAAERAAFSALRRARVVVPR
jgi:uncharacterized protein (DUF58 family)